ncbi:Uncharacterised protein [Kluyvera cryocrescens]|uniref:Uncharacterized protein n=1 Tax=Kluyvera cryocrescens TaxID=580 RepID=A0A485BVP6_KLUCR|nr:Uncharacterised protein [Kluyvera cryocrescens]
MAATHRPNTDDQQANMHGVETALVEGATPASFAQWSPQ